MNSQTSKANQFRDLHRGPRALILANVWDVGSARILWHAGFPALATTSAGIAFSLGYPDGEAISRKEMISRIALIARAVDVPVSADVESGYGSRPEDAATTARELIQAGAIGLNLEDASNNPDAPMLDLERAVEKIKAVRAAGEKMGVPIVINARTEVYLLGIGEPETRYPETLRRLSAYRDSGADCVFAPGLRDPETIGRLARDLKAPLNILAGPGSPSIPQLEKLGVARISLGSAPMRATMGLLRRMAEELRTSGTYGALEGGVPHAELNELFA